MMHEPYKIAGTEERDLLKSIDDRLSRIEKEIAEGKQVFAGFLAGPGRKLMALFGNGGKS